jgi:hypothetical protein
MLMYQQQTFGPIVTATASARMSTPCNMRARTSGPNRTSFAMNLTWDDNWHAAFERSTFGSRCI